MIFSNFLRYALLAMFFLTATACSKTTEHRSVAQGGQDSGGGNTTSSTLADVEFYYDKANKQMIFILAKFLDPRTIYHFKDTNKRFQLYEVSEKILDLVSDKNSLDNYLKIGLKTLVESSPIIIKKNSACSSLDKVHASASIKDFKVGSPICLSFSELKKLPKSSLEREIVSLLFHEYLHALGYDEPTAKVIQESLIHNFDRIFPNGTSHFERRRMNDSYNLNYNSPDMAKELILTTLTGKLRQISTAKNEKASTDFWPIICEKLEYTDIVTAAFQKENEQLLIRLGPQLIDSGDITDLKIEEHLNKIDALRYSIYKNSQPLKTLCKKSSDFNQLNLTEDNKSTFYRSTTILAEDMTNFIGAAISKTQLLLQKYN